LLASLHRAVRGGFPQIGERFSDSAVRSPHVRDYAGGLTQQRVAVNTPLEQLLDRLGGRLHGVNDSRGHSVHDLHSRILEGDPLDLVESYDLSHKLLQDSRVMPHLRNLRGIMRDTRQASEGILANVVPYIGRG